MTFAWYAHLRNLSDHPWIVAALVSWGIALFEYLLQVPANRIGFGRFELGQLKILQEVITLAVFVPFAVLYMKQPLKLNYLWSGQLTYLINGRRLVLNAGELAIFWAATPHQVVQDATPDKHEKIVDYHPFVGRQMAADLEGDGFDIKPISPRVQPIADQIAK